MAATGNIIVIGNVTGGPAGARTFGPISIILSDAADVTTAVALSVGDNTIAVPAKATCAVLMPPNSANPMPNPPYGGVLTLKGAGPDVGTKMSVRTPTLLSWELTNAPTSLIVNATVAGTVEVWFA